MPVRDAGHEVDGGPNVRDAGHDEVDGGPDFGRGSSAAASNEHFIPVRGPNVSCVPGERGVFPGQNFNFPRTWGEVRVNIYLRNSQQISKQSSMGIHDTAAEACPEGPTGGHIWGGRDNRIEFRGTLLLRISESFR